MIKPGDVLKETVFPVMGCTEPAAVALATALARSTITNDLPKSYQQKSKTEKKEANIEFELLRLRTSRSIFKNAMAVGIPPAAGEAGIHIAATMGLFLPPHEGLNLLKHATTDIATKAKDLIKNRKLVLEIDEREEEVFIEAMVIGKMGEERHVGEAVICGAHDKVVMLRRNGRIVWEKKETKNRTTSNQPDLSKCTLHELFKMAESITPKDKTYLLQGVSMNKKAAEEGLKLKLGLGIGASVQEMLDDQILQEDIITTIKKHVSAAADARMSGYEIEVMSSSGSGNQGIMAILPIAIAAETMGIDKTTLATALALSHLITAHMTKGVGLLSALCGCVVKAGIGAAAGIAYLLSQDEKVVSNAIGNMAGNIVGEICDGAKVGCAFKMSTAAATATESAFLAHKGVSIPWSNGIVGRDALQTIKNISKISQNMRDVDNAIVEIIKKQHTEETTSA